jgi:hypothetical protein
LQKVSYPRPIEYESSPRMKYSLASRYDKLQLSPKLLFGL